MGLFQSGFSLILLQFVLNWHLGPVLHSSELPWLLLCCTALAGQALGYGRSRPQWASGFLAVTISAPLLVVGVRCCATTAGTTLVLSGLLATAATFALSHLVSCYWRVRGDQSLVRFYRIELGGAISGLVCALLWGPLRSTQLFPWSVLVAAWPLGTRLQRLCLCCMALVSSLGFSSVCWQAARLAYPGSRLVALRISPYQYVEVVENKTGRFLFLNGLCHYGPTTYNQLNLYLAQLPAERLSGLARQSGCLVVGAGTFVAPALTVREGFATTVVELDPAVVALGLEHFQNERPGQDQFEVESGDVRRLLSGHAPFGLIVINLPAPYSLNVASLFTREFYQAARQKLRRDGLCTVFLGACLDPRGANDAQGPILSAMLSVFPHTLAISSTTCQNTVVIGSESRLSSEDWRKLLRRHGQNRFTLYSGLQLAELSRDFPPAGLQDLRLCAAFNKALWFGP